MDRYAVSGFAVQPDGRVLLGGTFSEVNWVARAKGIALALARWFTRFGFELLDGFSDSNSG